MESIDFGTLFQGFGTMIASGWFLASARMFLIALGFLLILFRLERGTRANGDDSDGPGNGSY